MVPNLVSSANRSRANCAGNLWDFCDPATIGLLFDFNSELHDSE
jgi:hypothetical protein